ncbi:MAG TPA: 3'-5' exonuclease [Gemmataceae bacterium]|nr:3'-5' exonuclease [Gemmataceae bacterium]
MFVFFDTETTGIPKRYDAPVTDLANWPRVVQVAWMTCTRAGEEIASCETIIQPEGFHIPAEVSRIHGITTERASQEGRLLLLVLQEFTQAVKECKSLVAHNISFDAAVLGAEYLRAKLPNPLTSRKQICTMLTTTNYCRLPGSRGFKWPKLIELHQKLFGKPHDDTHRALADVRACAKCFFELQRLGVIK